MKKANAKTAPVDTGTIFQVPTNGGHVTECDRNEAVASVVAGGIFTEQSVNEMLDNGEVTFSDDFYFATKPEALSKWATPAAEEDPDKEFNDATGFNGPVAKAISDAGVEARKMTEPFLYALADESNMETITVRTLTDVKENIGKKYTAKTLDSMIEQENVFGGNDGFRFGPSPEALQADFDKRNTPAVEETEAEPVEDKPAKKAAAPKAEKTEAETAKFLVGQRVKNVVTQAIGTVEDKKGTLCVAVPKAKGSGTKLVDLTEAWELAPEKNPEMAIEKAEPVIEAVAVVEDKPMTPKEVKRLNTLEAAIEQAKDALDSAPFVMGKALDEIRQNKWFRMTHKTFGEYAVERFGITREYAQQLAQISGFMDVANEALPGDTEMPISVSAAIALTRDTNRIAKQLGIGKTDVDALRPIIQNAVTLMADVAPRDDDGNMVITPRFVESFNETLRSHIETGTVEIDGKQMSAEDAKEAGLLNHAFREQVIGRAAEGILAQSEIIKSEARAAWDRQNEPVTNGGDGTAKPVAYFTGKAPELTVECSKHGKKPITSIGSGRFQTKCGCRWHIDSESEVLVCFETNGKRVKRG